MTLEQLGISKEEIIELAAQKLADEHGDYDYLHSTVEKKINERIEQVFASSINSKIEEFLNAEMERLLSTEICPVNIWGEKTGSPTTLKAALARHAQDFWSATVDNEGKVVERGAYYGKPRHEYLFSKIVGEEFRKVVEQNITNLVGAFKDSLKTDSAAFISDHIDSIIRVKTK